MRSKTTKGSYASKREELKNRIADKLAIRFFTGFYELLGGKLFTLGSQIIC